MELRSEICIFFEFELKQRHTKKDGAANTYWRILQRITK
jgi:hypothetical protein